MPVGRSHGVTMAHVERVYRRSHAMRLRRNRGVTGYVTSWKQRGVRAAVSRDVDFMQWLSEAAETMRAANDKQRSRLKANERGIEYKEQDYTEFATFREALLLADEKLKEHGDCDPAVFGWIYGAVAEAVFGPL